MGQKSWPKRKILIPEYEWNIEVYDPTVLELEELQKAFTVSDWPQIKKLVSGLFASWDAFDRNGVDIPLPSKEDSSPLDKIPQIALKLVVSGLLDIIRGGNASDPKVVKSDFEPSPTSAPAPEEKV